MHCCDLKYCPLLQCGVVERKPDSYQMNCPHNSAINAVLFAKSGELSSPPLSLSLSLSRPSLIQPSQSLSSYLSINIFLSIAVSVTIVNLFNCSIFNSRFIVLLILDKRKLVTIPQPYSGDIMEVQCCKRGCFWGDCIERRDSCKQDEVMISITEMCQTSPCHRTVSFCYWFKIIWQIYISLLHG